MPEVTCPQCGSRQPVDPLADGYRCIVCAASWDFVRCSVCGRRFHTRPGVRTWTCPNCGTPHDRDRRGISRPGRATPLIVAVVVAILIVGGLIALVRALGDGTAARSTPTSPTEIADPLRRVCRELSNVQILRVDALRRVATTLEEAAGDLRDLGDDQNAAAVEEIVAAIETYREVAEGGGDTVAATNQLLDSFDTLDCTGA